MTFLIFTFIAGLLIGYGTRALQEWIKKQIK